MDLFEKLSAEEISKQLRQPEGQDGYEIAQRMNESNAFISALAYNIPIYADYDHILEIGVGNGVFLPQLFKKASHIHITAVDYAMDMVEETKKNNQVHLEKQSMRVVEGDLHQMDFETETFDKVITVNTLYFWDDREKAIQEIHRVLKPDGQLVIGIRSREAVKNAPIEFSNFRFYSREEAIEFVTSYNFELTDFVHRKDGEMDAMALLFSRK